jgi:glycosidase
MVWWKEAFGYQIYIRSFYDYNNDGIGDLKGIIEKLDYLHDLGINLIWICPFYDSPMDDNGYDVRDFFKVSNEYGSLDDVKELTDKAHKLGIKVIIDLILNHTSDEHQWFIESKKSKNNPYRDYYIWRDPRIIDGKTCPPTNWASFFNGSCWKFDEGTNQYFMKIFSNKMPDLNWKNPAIIAEFENVIRFWHGLGIDGFRIDAVSHLEKAEFVDSNKALNNGYADDWGKFSNIEKLHDYLKQLNRKSFKKYNLLTIGEVGGGAEVVDALKYSSTEREELDMVFNFDHNWCNRSFEADSIDEVETDVSALKNVFNKWQTGLFGSSWNALYWLNHDHPRLLSHYGDRGIYKERSAKMLATAMYFMWGTPFIYNGEEIGMTNPRFTDISDIKDKSTVDNYYNLIKLGNDETKTLEKISLTTRDNARGLMQWNSSEFGGFSKSKAWRKEGNYKDVNVEDEFKDQDSILNFYKSVIKLRMTSTYKNVIVYGDYKQVLCDRIDIYAYIRKHQGKSLLILCNFTYKVAEIRAFNYTVLKVVLSNIKRSILDVTDYILELSPFEALVLEID